MADTIETIRRARSVQELNKVTVKIARKVGNLSTLLNTVVRPSKLRIKVGYKSKSVDYNSGNINIGHNGVGPIQKIDTSKPTPESAVTQSIKSFRPPKIDSVNQHIKVIHELYENSLELDSVEALLIQGFTNSKGQPEALKAVRILKKNVEETVNAAFNSLSEISNASLPKELHDLGQDLIQSLILSLDRNDYKDMEQTSYVLRTKDSKWHYSYFVTIYSLKNEAGFVIEEYNVVLSAIIDANKKVIYHLTTIPEFKIPGKFPVGRQVKSSVDMRTALKIMLRHTDVINVLNKRAMPIDTETARRRGLASIPGVADSTVEEDSLFITFTKKKPTDAEVENVVKQVMPLLRILTNNKVKKADITYKPVPSTKGFKLEFILTSLKGSTGLSIDKLNDLKHALDWSDDDLEDLKHALKSVK